MEHNFWHERWQEKQIGFHNKEVNPLLSAHLSELNLAPNSTVYVPLCGKTLDIGFLLSQGHRVVGVELSEIAVCELFEEMGVTPTVTADGEHSRYSAENLDILVGDAFTVTPEQLGNIDAVYDRAALVALPPDMRLEYAAKLRALAADKPMLLISFEYDQEVIPGPPFCVHEDEVRALYQDTHQVAHVYRQDVAGGLKGVCPAEECVWLLSPLA